ncbi:hypothetical protein I6F65_17550 [Pseudoalteromonas sp. SWXJZ94C]|uniref:hypothetical protein n=1 Tax=Pseudoalteromonas sp. SWXJZ94C TaxID=2792065 RepID=UPI0018CC9B5D|nr:hypothetical protein [Pseudoalteromonas sp. SWXJZ94C]MBH0058751.1 hypothetical protein [Pseudoalteromonas sp. SWXJZ94C]
MVIPDEPLEFRELCEKVGLALIMGQKVQYSLVYFYSVYHQVNSGWSKDKSKEKANFYLSKAMGNIVNAIKKDDCLDQKLFEQVIQFKKDRNWLAHDFDEESTRFLAVNERFQHYIDVMDNITQQALLLIKNLDQVGKAMVPTGT